MAEYRDSRRQSPEPALISDSDEDDMENEEMDIESLRQQNILLQEKLDQYDAERLDNEPEDSITDSFAKEAYQGIVLAIEQWIYNARSDLKTKLGKHYQDALSSYAARADFPNGFATFSNADFFLLTRLILVRLHEDVFTRCHPIGFDKDQAKFLDQAMESMEANNDRWDASQMRKWRLQTCKLLMGHPDFKKQLHDEIGYVCGKLASELRQWFASGGNFDRHKQALLDDVVAKAGDLQRRFSLSAHAYKFHFREPADVEKMLHPSRSDCILRDMETWRVPEPDRDTDDGAVLPPSIIGELSPRLTRTEGDANDFLVMKPIVVIAKTQPRDRAAKTRRSSTAQPVFRIFQNK